MKSLDVSFRPRALQGLCQPKAGAPAARRRAWRVRANSSTPKAAGGEVSKQEPAASAASGPREAAANSATASPGDGDDRQQKQKHLNAQLCTAQSAAEVLGVLAAHSCEELGDRNCITAFHRLAKLAGPSRARAEALRSSLVARLVAHLERPTMQWTAMGVANVLWAHAALGHGSRALLNKAFRQLDVVTVEDSAACFGVLVHGMARLRRPHAGYLRRLSAALAAEGQRAKQGRRQAGGPGGVTEGAGAGPEGRDGLARQQQEVAAGDGSPRDGNSTAEPPPALLGRLGTQQLCLLAHSLASLGSSGGRALLACLHEIAGRDLRGLSAASLCQVARAMVAGERYHAAACDAVADAVASLPDAALDGETCSRLLHDYALIYQKHLLRRGHNPSHRLQWQAAVRSFVGQALVRRGMLLRLVQRSQQEVGAMGTVSLTSLVWGLATLGQREGPLLEAVAVRAVQLGTQQDAQGVASICWAFSALHHDHPQMMDALAGTALALLSDPGRRSEFTAQAVPMLALSYAVLNRCESPAASAMLHALAARAGEILPELTPQGLSNLGWALAAARAFPPPLARAWRAAVAARLPACGPAELNQLHQVEMALRLEAAGAEAAGAAGASAPAAAEPAALRVMAKEETAGGVMVGQQQQDKEQQPPLLTTAAGEAQGPYTSLLESLYQSGRMRSTAKRGWEREQQWGHRTVTRWQEKVHRALCLLGVECELEFLGEGSEYSADIAIPSQRIAVECDGPAHFMANSRHVEGATVFKRRLLEQLGWRVVAIPYFDWPKERKAQQEYLVRVLGEAGLHVPPRAQPQGPQEQQQEQQQQQQARERESQQEPGLGRQPADLAAPTWGQPTGERPAAAAAAAGDEEVEPEAAAAALADPRAGTAPLGAAAIAGAPRAGGSPPPQQQQYAADEAGGEQHEGAALEPGKEGGTRDSGAIGGPIAERARRLAMLQYKAGKLSRSQLLAREGMVRQGKPVAE